MRQPSSRFNGKPTSVMRPRWTTADGRWRSPSLITEHRPDQTWSIEGQCFSALKVDLVEYLSDTFCPVSGGNPPGRTSTQITAPAADAPSSGARSVGHIPGGPPATSQRQGSRSLQTQGNGGSQRQNSDTRGANSPVPGDSGDRGKRAPLGLSFLQEEPCRPRGLPPEDPEGHQQGQRPPRASPHRPYSLSALFRAVRLGGVQRSPPTPADRLSGPGPTPGVGRHHTRTGARPEVGDSRSLLLRLTAGYSRLCRLCNNSVTSPTAPVGYGV